MRALVGTLIGIAFVVAVVIGAMGELSVKCEVCMRYGRGEVCERARAADREHAVMQATSAACTRLSSGVTDGIRCGNTPPVSTHCTD